MAKYSYITDKTHNNRKIQVESAKRDGSGKNIENNYAKQNGNYQSLTAGLSNNFDTKKVMVDESAYNFRPTATMGSVELEVGSPCKVKKIVGGSVAFNQRFCVRNTSETYGSLTLTPNTTDNSFTLNGTGSGNSTYMTISGVDLPIGCLANGHKYIITGVTALFSKARTLSEDTAVHIPNVGCQTKPYTGTIKEDTIFAVTNNNTSVTRFYLYLHNGDSWNNAKGYINLIDLTQMFGSTIADYIYSLEQANAGSGVAWFKRYFPKEYYAYNSGELVSVKTQGKKITHFNQFDKSKATLNKLLLSDGTEYSSSTYFHSDFIMCLPNTQYYIKNTINWDIGSYALFYDKDKNLIMPKSSPGGDPLSILFTTPANAYYFIINGKKANIDDVCVNFHYDGERDGEYEPYNSETYACDDIDLRGIPQLDENNNLAFDGDEYANDGNVTRKYGIVDLGTLEWNYNSSVSLFNSTLTDGKTSTNLICKLYKPYELSGGGNDPDMCMFVYDGTLYITNSNYTDTQTFKTAMSGVYLVYELATPTDENSIPFTEVQECDNWGTEEWLAPTTDTRPCEVPVGHETDYLPDLKAKLEVAPNTPNENGVYVMEHNASGNSYTPIATWLTDNGYAKADTLPTKDSVGGTLRQLLSVKESLDFDDTDFVDLGSLEWSGGGVDANFYSSQVLPNTGVAYKSVCTKYIYNQGAYAKNSMADKSIGFATDGRIYCRDDNYADGNSLKQALKGVLLAYEKAS